MKTTRRILLQLFYSLLLFVAYTPIFLNAAQQQSSTSQAQEKDGQMQELEKLIDQWKKVLAKEAAANEENPKRPNPFVRYPDNATDSVVWQLKRSIIDRNYNSARQQAVQLFHYGGGPEAKKLVEMILATVEKSQKEFEEHYIKQADEIVIQTGKQCLAAKGEKDLDSLLEKLGEIRSRDYSNNPLLQRAHQKIDAAIQFVTRWQDYLAQQKAGNQNQADEILRNLTFSGTGYPILSRSELIALRQDPQKSEKQERQKNKLELQNQISVVMNNVKNLEDVDDAIEKLQKIDYQSGEELGILEDLKTTRQRYLAYQNGAYGLFMDRSPTAVLGQPIVHNLNVQLLKLIILKHLGYSDIESSPEGENPSDWLRRLIEKSVKEKQWDRASKIMDVYRTVAFSNNSPDELNGDIIACNAYLAGQRLEAANQYMAAVESYQKVIDRGAKYAPLSEATERLKILNKEHPEIVEGARKQNPLQNTSQ